MKLPLLPPFLMALLATSCVADSADTLETETETETEPQPDPDPVPEPGLETPAEVVALSADPLFLDAHAEYLQRFAEEGGGPFACIPLTEASENAPSLDGLYSAPYSSLNEDGSHGFPCISDFSLKQSSATNSLPNAIEYLSFNTLVAATPTRAHILTNGSQATLWFKAITDLEKFDCSMITTGFLNFDLAAEHVCGFSVSTDSNCTLGPVWSSWEGFYEKR